MARPRPLSLLLDGIVQFLAPCLAGVSALPSYGLIAEGQNLRISSSELLEESGIHLFPSFPNYWRISLSFRHSSATLTEQMNREANSSVADLQ